MYIARDHRKAPLWSVQATNVRAHIAELPCYCAGLTYRIIQLYLPLSIDCIADSKRKLFKAANVETKPLGSYILQTAYVLYGSRTHHVELPLFFLPTYNWRIGAASRLLYTIVYTYACFYFFMLTRRAP